MADKQIGKLPVTEIIKLESSKEQWEVFAKGLVPHFSTTGIISLSDEKKVRITIKVIIIFPPAAIVGNFKAYADVANSKEFSSGIQRIDQHFLDLKTKDMWILFGFIEGKNKIPIMISYSGYFDIAIYTIKLEKEEEGQFFPAGLPKNSEWN